jgi:hypothetical protein
MISDADPKARAAKLQRQVAAFGGVRSPLDQQIDRNRIVVAGPQMFEIPSAWSFHEFLLSYGQSQLGEDWIISNAQTHPLVTHLIKGKAGIRPTCASDSKFVGGTMNGDLFAFLSFAYDLFTLADNAVVQKSLFDRLRKPDQYQGARYEMFVAASLLRAGFKVAFEDESDSLTSHCEFTATSKQTNRSFSVEAKSRHRKPLDSDDKATPKSGMYSLMQRALAKKASHERIIFADVNLPPDDQPVFQQSWHQEVAATLNELEQKQRENDPWPQAIVFFTNRKTSPWPSKEAGGNTTVLLTAINHPLFKTEELRGGRTSVSGGWHSLPRCERARPPAKPLFCSMMRADRGRFRFGAHSRKLGMTAALPITRGAKRGHSSRPSALCAS